MTVRDRIRPLPGVRAVSLLRQRIGFRGSAAYWERHYACGGDSGPGSAGPLAQGKAAFLNAFVAEHGIQSVIEFGCGDGHQLSLAHYPRYVGLDVSPSALARCARRFADDRAKAFFRYDDAFFAGPPGRRTAELAISLDVIYHLVERPVFETYLARLFAAGQRFVVVYSTDTEIGGTAPHVRHRRFTAWVAGHCPPWRLAQVVPGPNAGPARADFFVYERAG